MFPAFAAWPDRWHEPKPFDPAKTRWHRRINPACCGGHPCQMLQTCGKMIPPVARAAGGLHENTTFHPYIRMRQLLEAIRDYAPIPPSPREALPPARAAADNPWQMPKTPCRCNIPPPRPAGPDPAAPPGPPAGTPLDGPARPRPGDHPAASCSAAPIGPKTPHFVSRSFHGFFRHFTAFSRSFHGAKSAPRKNFSYFKPHPTRHTLKHRHP